MKWRYVKPEIGHETKQKITNKSQKKTNKNQETKIQILIINSLNFNHFSAWIIRMAICRLTCWYYNPFGKLWWMFIGFHNYSGKILLSGRIFWLWQNHEQFCFRSGWMAKRWIDSLGNSANGEYKIWQQNLKTSCRGQKKLES